MLIQLFRRISCNIKYHTTLFNYYWIATVRTKSNHVNYSFYPQINEDEIEETFVRESGPGGQAVNKTSNCVVLQHLPTKILIKCHAHRTASRNHVEARRLLMEKLDALQNGERAVAAKLKALENKKRNDRKRLQKINKIKKAEKCEKDH